MRLIQDGPRDAKIVIVGEAPGKQEDESGVPFSGGSGQILNDMLGRVGLHRAEIFVTNLCHTRPPNNKFDWFVKPKLRPEFMLGVMQLKKDLAEIKPNLVIGLGAWPLKILTGKSGIDKWRGSILEASIVPRLKVVCTYHPAYILRVWNYKAVAEVDLARCAEESRSADIALPQRDLILDPPLDIRNVLVEELYRAEWLAMDIECFETEMGTWRLACVGFSDTRCRAVTIPCRNQGDLDVVRRLCASPAKKIMQNGYGFDYPVLLEEGIEVKNFVWDTMLAHHAIYPEAAGGGDEMAALQGNKKKRSGALKKGLAFQTSIYTREPFYKDDGKLWKLTNDLQMFWRYNALDAAVTREIKDVQATELDAFRTRHIFDHAMQLVWPLMEATRRGHRIDVEERATLRHQITTERDNLQRFLDKAAGESINVKSSPQIRTLLYNKLKLPAKYKKAVNADGDDELRETADKDAIVALAEKHPHPVLLTILAIRKRRDLLERYVDAKIDGDGRMRCSFDIAGTNTGRLSSRISLHGSGTNLQTIPSSLRRMFIADEGMVLVGADYSQAEARVVAYLARCTGLIELFESGRDVHTENASRIFGKAAEDITPEERFLAKKVVHATNYGMGPDKLAAVVNQEAEFTGIKIDIKKARNLVERYFFMYPEIKTVFWKDIREELHRTRILVGLFGRKRQFFARWDEKLLQSAYAYKPQNCVGEMTNRAIVRLWDMKSDCQLLLNVHDYIHTQCPDTPDNIKQTAADLRQAMDITLEINGMTCHIPVDVKMGKNWGEYIDEETATKRGVRPNLNGMRKLK